MEDLRVTVKEIARLAGVSIGTVDRVLHGRPGVSPETKERIEEIVRRLGYRPNLLARQLSLGKTYVFHVLLPRAEQDSGYWALCLEGIRRAERDLGPLGILVAIDEFDRYDLDSYERLLAKLIADPGDGLLVAPVLPARLMPALAELEKQDIPYVFFDRDVAGARPVAAVGQDPFRGGYLAGRLMSLLAGAEGNDGGRLVAVSAHAGDPHIGRRIEGFRAFFAASGRARPVEAAECQSLEGPEECDRFLSGLLAGGEPPAGILVANSSGHLVGGWLAAKGAKPGCAILSWDLVPANARAMMEGKIDCVVSQRPAEQAREALERLYKAAVRGEGIQDSPHIPLEVYFRENIPQDGEGGLAALKGADHGRL